MKKPNPIFLFAIYFPLVFATVYYTMQYLLTAKNVVNLPKMTNRQAALRFGSLASIPLMAMILFVAQYRYWGAGWDPIKYEPSIFFRLCQNVLQNTLEQTFFFVVVLWAAAEWSMLSTERLFLFAVAFAVCRLVYAVTYIAGVKLGFAPLRAYGFVLTFALNTWLLLYNAMLMLEMGSYVNASWFSQIK